METRGDVETWRRGDVETRGYDTIRYDAIQWIVRRYGYDTDTIRQRIRYDTTRYDTIRCDTMVRETILRIRYGYDTITVAIRHDAIRYAGS